jgi:hypothetical protein
MTDFHITIDMDKKCAECGKGGAVPSGICLKCTTKAAYSEKPLKSWQAKAVRERMNQERSTRGQKR